MMEDLKKKYMKQAEVGPEAAAFSKEFLQRVETKDVLDHYAEKTKKHMEDMMKFVKG